MPINPNISLAVKGIELQDPLVQYGRVAAIQQAQQQTALANMQMQEYSRAREEEQGIRNRLAGGASLEDAETRNFLLGSKSGREILQRHSDLQASQTKQQTSQTELLDSKLKQSRQFLEHIDPSSPNAAEEYIQWLEANHADPVIGPALKARKITLDMATQRALPLLQTPGGLARLINESKLGTEKFMEMNKPQLSTTDLGGKVVSRTFQPLTGELKTISDQTKTMAPGESQRIGLDQQRLGLDQQRLGLDQQRLGLEGRRVDVLEENNRRDADPAFQQRMGAARATGQAIAMGDVAAMRALPKVIGEAELVIGLLDQMVGKRDSKTGELLKGEKPHPGFAPAVGIGGWVTLGIPGLAQITPGTDAANFKTLYDQVGGEAFLEAFETLKGGGAITEKEGIKATAARNRMSLAQSEDEFVKASLEYRDIVVKGVERAQSKAARAGGGGAPAPAASAGGGNDAALNWARENPKDPRAAVILQRLGVR